MIVYKKTIFNKWFFGTLSLSVVEQSLSHPQTSILRVLWSAASKLFLSLICFLIQTGGGFAKNPLSYNLNFVVHIPQWWNLAQLYFD